MLPPTDQSLSSCPWTVGPAGDLSETPSGFRRQPIGARVPGCVHADLLRAGLIEHPDRGQAELDQRWIGRTDWEYRCRFRADAALFDHERIDLVFECLDTVSAIALNGTEIGRAASAFLPHRFDARRALRRGDNELVISFASPMRHLHAEDARLGPLPRNGDWDPFNTIRKPACDFGWDWGPRTATSGVSGHVRLEAWSVARLASLRPLVARVGPHEWRLNTHAAVEWSGPDARAPLVLRAQLRVNQGNRQVLLVDARTVPAGAPSVSVSMRVDDPLVWWPTGYGAPALHDLNVSLQRPDGTGTLGAHRSRVGFRTVELDTSPDDRGDRFALRINGREIFCTGANLVPIAPLDLENGGAWTELLMMGSRNAGMNILRVWGGGRYEPDAFYRACDEAGIMVWQDFMFACALYAEEEPLRSLVDAEARHHVSRLSAHPSVVLWCGGNETVWGYQRWGWRERVPPGRSWGAGYWTKLLPDIVRELDPTRPYWPNSPWSGSLDRDTLDPDRGDRHTWDAEFEGYRATIPRFVSEFGRQAPANYSTLAGAIGPEHLRVRSPGFERRQRATGGTATAINKAIEKHFGSAERSFDEWHYLAQLLQARAVKIGVSWARCNRPRCSGVLVWQLNDVWACPSWSLIDSQGLAKPAWIAFRRAAAPRACFFHQGPGQDGPFVYAVNDTDDAWDATATVRRVHLDGTHRAVGEARLALPPRSAACIIDAAAVVGRPGEPHREMLLLDPPDRNLDARDTWLSVSDRELDESIARYRVTFEGEPGRPSRLCVEAESIVRDIILQLDRVDPSATPDTQVITLLPGERATFSFTARRDLAFPLRPDLLGRPPVLWCANALGRRGGGPDAVP